MNNKYRGFLEHARYTGGDRPVEERVKDWKPVHAELGPEETRRQATRCMDCGVPFCMTGCPLGNAIPDWNDDIFRDVSDKAYAALTSTNNFPEFTGLVCPAPCESSCVLGINAQPVAIKRIEWEIARRQMEQGPWTPQPATRKTGKRVAIVGSGPAGLAAAQNLARAGHEVTVFEKNERPGGLLRFGIPDFKLDKVLIDARVTQLEAEGVSFECGVEVGNDMAAETLRTDFDAVLLAIGAESPRDLPIPGRELDGVHFAMDFLSAQNRRVAGSVQDFETAQGKHVVVIGGGDTGSDCIGTSIRQGALSVTNFELLPLPPESRPPSQPWPEYPRVFRVSSSHQEGCERRFSIMTTAFVAGENGRVTSLEAVEVEFAPGSRRPTPIPGTEFTIPADLVLLAMGFVHPRHDALIEQLKVDTDGRGNVKANASRFATSVPGVFAAGDARRGQSLVVWAIWEGREAARAIDTALMGRSELPARDSEGLR